MLIQALLTILAAIHLLPALAAIAPTQLQKLYGVSPNDRDLIVLLQHRAVMLGVIGGLFAAAIFMLELRWPVLVGGALSMVAFLVIASQHRALGGALRKIALVDALGLPVVSALAFLMAQN